MIDRKALLLIAISATVIIIAFFMPRIPQPPDYHKFADERNMAGIPNGLNVLSNLAFILAGLWGLAAVTELSGRAGGRTILLSYASLFAGVFLTGIGSAYYHLNPSDETLFWDRLPMTIAFAGFFCTVLSEQISPRTGLAFLPPMLAFGAFSVYYWAWTEKSGSGDLRPYVIDQFLPMLLIPLILYIYDSRSGFRRNVILLLACYTLAKAFEFLDGAIYSMGNVVSGHTLKHIFAGGGVLFMVRALRSRIQILPKR